MGGRQVGWEVWWYVPYFAQRGVDARRTLAVGYGETRPITENAIREGRDRNRRIEIRLTDGPE